MSHFIHNGKRIVIIDDSLYQREILFKQLTEDGYDIVGLAENAKDGFRVVATERPDLVIVDLSLPDLPAEEVIRGIKSINQKIFTVISAPLGYEEDVNFLMRLGCDEFLPKPIETSHLEYILNKFEVLNFPKVENRTIGINFLHQTFYNQMIQYASDDIKKIISKTIVQHSRTLARKYPERFFFDARRNYLHVILPHKQGDGSKKFEKVIVRQLENLLTRILNSLEKKIPIEMLLSLLHESFLSYASLVKPVADYYDYDFPDWKSFKFEVTQPDYLSRQKTKIEYISNSEFNWPEIPQFAEIQRINAYRVDEKGDFPQRTLKETAHNIHIVLSVFDEIYGPKVGITRPPNVEDRLNPILRIIPSLMDRQGLKEMDPFLYSETDFGCLNLVFSVKKEGLRGSRVEMMISILITPITTEILLKLSQMKGILRAIAAQIRFHVEESEYSNPEEILTFQSEISDLLSVFHHEVRSFMEY
ncbi:MAG: response regulator [Methanobacteriota archaeon]|nr:MAG: response regulator [Euryarchaeota archaeon]